MDARVPMDVVTRAFGVNGTVALPPAYQTAVSTKIVWLPPITVEVPNEGGYTRREQRLVMALDKAQVLTVPRGTQILAPAAEGGANKKWLVDSFVHGDDEHHRVVVIEVEHFP